jgi:energy-converting hydrogenase Eha subunit A
MFYDYAILVAGSFLAYRGAPAWSIVVVAMLLSLPRIAVDRAQRHRLTKSMFRSALSSISSKQEK